MEEYFWGTDVQFSKGKVKWEYALKNLIIIHSFVMFLLNEEFRIFEILNQNYFFFLELSI